MIGKDIVNDWLEAEGRSRDWLADQCGVSRRTVDNWLVSPRGVPKKACLLIRSLMDEDAARAELEAKVPQNLVLEFEPHDFDTLCDAAMRKGQNVRTYSTESLKKLARLDMAEVAETLRSEFPPKQGKQYTIRQPYAVAAGIGNDGDDMGEVPCFREYPKGCFGIRVIGDSMDDGSEDAIPDGSLAILKPMGSQPYAKKGKVYAWTTPEGNILKRYNTKVIEGTRQKVLESLNPDFRDISVTEEMSPIGEFICVDGAE